MVDDVIDKKIMGSVLGYVGSSKQRTIRRYSNPATDHPLPGERQDTNTLCRRSTTATKRHVKILTPTNGDNPTILVSVEANLARHSANSTNAKTTTRTWQIPGRAKIHGNMATLSKPKQYLSRHST